MNKQKNPVVQIESFNPYKSLFPVTRVVSRETLHFIKMLRSQGYSVSVVPDDGSKLHYVAQKGIKELFSDPIFMYVVGIATNIICNFATDWIKSLMRRESKQDDPCVIIRADKQGTLISRDHKGHLISEKRLQAVRKLQRKKESEFRKSLNQRSPFSDLPTPIYLNHSGIIIGWGKVSKYETGLKVDDARIINAEVSKKVKAGELEGFSIAGLVYESECSVCGNEYTECNHFSGQTYDGIECIVEVKAMHLAEISIVKSPAQPLATVHLRS